MCDCAWLAFFLWGGTAGLTISPLCDSIHPGTRAPSPEVVKNDVNEASDGIISFVNSIVPTATVVSDVSAEISFKIGMNDVSNFEQLFMGLDQN